MKRKNKWFKHNFRFNKRIYAHSTILFKHIWPIKDEMGKSPIMKLDIAKKAQIEVIYDVDYIYIYRCI